MVLMNLFVCSASVVFFCFVFFPLPLGVGGWLRFVWLSLDFSVNICIIFALVLFLYQFFFFFFFFFFFGGGGGE